MGSIPVRVTKKYLPAQVGRYLFAADKTQKALHHTMQGLLLLESVLRFPAGELRGRQARKAQPQHGQGGFGVELMQGGKGCYGHAHGQGHPLQDEGDKARCLGRGRRCVRRGPGRLAQHQLVHSDAQRLGQFGQGSRVRQGEVCFP